MKKLLLVVTMIALGTGAVSLAQSAKEREARQAELDATCEAARDVAIAAAKVEHIEECVEKEQRPDRAACERFYVDYGRDAATGVPLYYDLPQCEAAHDYRTSYRS